MHGILQRAANAKGGHHGIGGVFLIGIAVHDERFVIHLHGGIARIGHVETYLAQHVGRLGSRAHNVAAVVNRNRIATRIDRTQHVGSIGLRRLASTNAIHHFRNRIVGRNLMRFTARLRRIRRQSSNLHILGRNGANALEECSDCLYVHVGLHEVRKSVHAHIVAKPTLYRGRLLHKGHCHERLYLTTRLFSVHGVIICSACENRLLAAESLLACRKPHIARLGIDDIFGKIDINAAKFVNELSEILRINRCIMGQLDAQEAVHRANQARAALGSANFAERSARRTIG